MREPQRLFTLDEIQGLLPDLELRISRFLAKKAAYARMHDHLLMEELLQDIESRQGTASSGGENEAGKLEQAVGELEQEIAALRRLGCLLTDLEKGWIDFPAVKDNERICFCWKRGDDRVKFYRVFGASAGERKPLDELSGKS